MILKKRGERLKFELFIHLGTKKSGTMGKVEVVNTQLFLLNIKLNPRAGPTVSQTS